MRSLPSRRTIAFGLCAIAVLALCYQFIGGPARLLISSGTSMEPGIGSGDLIIVKRQAAYQPGDVVAYRSGDLGTVLHRIVDISEGPEGVRFEMKGDNSNFIDADQPEQSAVIGEAVFRLPAGGKLLGLLPIGAAGILAGYWIYSGSSTGRGRGGARVTLRSRDVRQLTGVSVVALAAGVGVLAALSPVSVPRDRDVPYETVVDVSWSAQPPASVVYPDGRLGADDPIFLSEIDHLTISAHLAVAMAGADANVDATGTVALAAIVSDDTGWSHRFELDSGVDLVDGAAEAEGTLDLTALHLLLGEVTSRTGYTPPRYDVVVVLGGAINASLAGEPIDEMVHHEVELVMDQLVLAPTAATSWSATIPGTVSVEETGEATLGVGPLEMPVGLLRVVAPFAIVAGLVLALWSKPELAPYEMINQHFADFVLHVNNARLPTDGAMVTVACFEDLLRIAQIEGSPILHIDGDVHEWATLAMGVWYRFQLVNATVAATAAVRGEIGAS